MNILSGTDKSAMQLAAGAWSMLESVFAEVDALAAVAASKSSHALQKSGGLTSVDFRSLTPRITEALQRLGMPVQGLGIILDTETLSDQQFWLSWIVLNEDGTTGHSHHVTDPRREDFYEYPLAEWMSTPRRTQASAIVGPYVDYGGTDDYILTLSSPITVDGRFLGVAAADIPLARFERILAAGLHKAKVQCALLNSEGRVVVSNCTQLSVGSLVDPRHALSAAPCGDMGWNVITI